MGSLTTKSKETQLDLHKEQIKKILLIRANFRMGDLILATPGIFAFRKAFPSARIDFVGAPMSKKLFQNLPIDHHYSISRRYPQSAWDYLILIKQLRSVGYDLAVELSCSQSAMGSFIAGFSRARFRAGLQGEWDQWFNVRIPRPPEKNKYRILPAFLKVLGLDTVETLPSLFLSSAEQEEGRIKIDALASWPAGPTVGVFIGGRKTWGKSWPIKNFCELITALHWRGANVVTFVGPEEKNVIGFFMDALEPRLPVAFEPSPRDFAAMVSNCDLFVTCDSGPMHLACALGTRTVAIFQNSNFDHWGPPPTLGRIVYQPGGCSVEDVLGVCLAELAHNLAPASDFCGEALVRFSDLVPVPHVTKAVRRLELSLFTQRLLFFSRCTQALFFLALIVYAWFFPPSGIFEDGTWSEAFTDTVGIGSLIGGGFLRIWAASHIGAWTGPQRLKAPTLIMRGPYAYVRHPMYIGNFMIGLGITVLLEAFFVVPLLLALAVLHFIVVIPTEESFLKEKLGEGYELYCYLVPQCIPKIKPDLQTFSLGRNLPLKELGTAGGLIAGAYVLEWLESPLHRRSIVDLFHWLAPRISL